MKGVGLSSLNFSSSTSVRFAFFADITSRRISSKKHLVVASTSAEALMAHAKTSPKSFLCKSVSEGYLKPPPLPPGI